MNVYIRTACTGLFFSVSVLAKSMITCVDFSPNESLKQAAKEIGAICTESGSWPESSDVVIIGGALEDEKTAQVMMQAVEKGIGLIVMCDEDLNLPEEVQRRLPVNKWSIYKGKRGSTEQGSTVISPFEFAAFDWKNHSLPLAARHDVRLPFSPFESGMQRYLDKATHKSLKNTDWSIEFASEADYGLPVLVAGRYGRSRIFVFGGDFKDPQLAESPESQRFFQNLLKHALSLPKPVSGSSEGIDRLVLQVSQHQTDGVSVVVENRGDKKCSALLSYKTANWAYELFNSATIPVKLGPGESVRVPVDQPSKAFGQPFMPREADSIPYRRVHVGILSPDGAELITETRQVISVVPQIGMEIFDATDPVDMNQWPQPRVSPRGERKSDGRIGRRFAYPLGKTAEFNVSLSNGLTNLAPLARVEDLSEKENASRFGLNDLSFSDADNRGKHPDRHGVYEAKSKGEKSLSLSWEKPVFVAAHQLEGFGEYRRWRNHNPQSYILYASDGSELLRVDHAEYEAMEREDDVNRFHFAPFKPTRLDELNMHIRNTAGGNDKKKVQIVEWNVLGFPGNTPPESLRGEFTVSVLYPFETEEKVLLKETVTLAAFERIDKQIAIRSPAQPGPVKVILNFTSGTTECTETEEAFYFEDDNNRMLNENNLADVHKGFLCSPGWAHGNLFGIGMRSRTKGWGGPDDKIWAGVHNLLETGTRDLDEANRMFTMHKRFCHYTNPWRSMPNGVYSWNMQTEGIIQRLLNGADPRWRGKSIHITGSDRWNGINIGRTWGWGEFILFDKFLNEKGLPGLKEKTRLGIHREISENYGDLWQKWQLERYASALEKSQERFTKDGLEFVGFTTHGSFPFCGGELGERLAKTHIAVGTDVFWEARKGDLLQSAGKRWGIIAVNPDLRSGCYGQWGWPLADPTTYWYSHNDAVEPSRRQWIQMYFTGRINSSGEFRPYHVYGFSFQGHISTQFYQNDFENWFRTMNFTVNVRPEQASGFGMIASWKTLERNMGKELGRQGFGLYPDKGTADPIKQINHLYRHLTVNSIPIQFFSSTDALKKWKGTQPLIIPDGFLLTGEEIGTLERLNKRGATIIAFSAIDPGFPASAEFYGIRTDGTSSVAEKKSLGNVNAYVRTDGPAPVILFEVEATKLDPFAAKRCAELILQELKHPIRLPIGLTAAPFVSDGALFMGLCDYSERHRNAKISMNPGFFMAELDNAELKLAVLEDSKPLPFVRNNDGTITFELPMAAADAKVVMIKAGEETK